MAFIGTPVLTKVTDKLFRITGVSLAANTSGVIVVRPGTTGTTPGGAIVLQAPSWTPYEYAGALVDLDSSVKVSVVQDGVAILIAVPVSIVKTVVVNSDGTHEVEATIKNVLASGSATDNLEIYVEWAGH
jgi:hypothetical protein